MQKRKIFVFFITFFSFYGLFPLFSENSENSEDEASMSLRQIDRLINNKEERDFQKALLELNKYLTANPEQFDSVQKRYKKILNSKDRYSELANQLMQLIRDSSEEDTEVIDEKMMKLTDQILSIERNPGDERLEIVKDTNYLVSIRQYSAIQNKTASLVQAKKYSEAIVKALDGFEILHENFIAKYGNEKVRSDVDSAISNIKSQLDAFNLVQEKIKNQSLIYINAVNAGNDYLAQNALYSVKTAFDEYARMRNSVLESGLVIDSALNSVKKLLSSSKKYSSSAEEDKFLKHGDEYPGLASGVVFGWSENPDPDHGLLGVMDALFNCNVEEMKKVSFNAINRCAVQFSDLSSVQAFRQSGTLPDKNELFKIENFGKCALEINNLYSLLKNKNGKGNKLSYQNYYVSIDYIVNLASNTEGFVDNVIKIDKIKSKADVISAPVNAGQEELAGSNYVQSLLGVASEISTVVKTINSNSSKNSSWGEEYRNRLEKQKGQIEKIEAEKSSGIRIEDRVLSFDKIEVTYNDYISAAEDYASDSVVEIYSRSASHYALCGKEYVEKADSDVLSIKTALDGENVDGMQRRYSKIAFSKVNQLNKYLSDSKTVLNNGLRRVETKNQSSYSESIEAIHASIAHLEEISVNNKPLSDLANELIRNSEKNISEAEKNMAASERLYRQKKFDEARNLANNAMESYNASLRYNYDEDLALKSRKNIENLLSQIAEQQKIVIDQEVNALIAQANREFNNDNYAQSQTLLNRAQERWNVTFAEYENLEISNMQKIVENALNANNGREVLPSDSLYLDVSQMLRSAGQSFDKGKSLAKKGKTELAGEQFNEALQTLEILRSLVPRNMAANKLRLEIQQFQDPEQFEINFSNRVSQAKENAAAASKGSRDNEKLLQAYSDLCDLAEIKSDYPGLQSAILELEYTLGKKTRPVSQKDKNRAKQLANEAQRLLNNGKTQDAFNAINEAIALDSGNASFKTIRSNISARLKTKVYTRDANYADRYQEVVELISTNRYELAQGIISELWKNPANRTENLEKLKNRVERALGS